MTVIFIMLLVAMSIVFLIWLAEIVETTVGRHCSIRNWKLQALGVRSSHIHVVVAAPSYKPDTVASQFKARISFQRPTHFIIEIPLRFPGVALPLLVGTSKMLTRRRFVQNDRRRRSRASQILENDVGHSSLSLAKTGCDKRRPRAERIGQRFEPVRI